MVYNHIYFFHKYMIPMLRSDLCLNYRTIRKRPLSISLAITTPLFKLFVFLYTSLIKYPYLDRY